MKRLKELFILFLTFFKIGLFTFGGGYAMISLLSKELVERKKWIENDEFIDVIAIAESTPGPIAINSATYIGYKQNGFWGSVFSTLGVVLPSLIIILIISFFYEIFIEYNIVRYAFQGIQACIVYLILSAGLKMFIKTEKSLTTVLLFIISLAVILILKIFSVSFSSILFILAGAVIGAFVYLLNKLKKSNKEDK